MAKDPVLPLYYNDITTSTQDWTDEEFGAYMRLLIHQWRQGGLPKDYQRLARIATSLDTNWPMLKLKFVEIDGVLKNEVMEDIREKRDKHKERQKENALKRYQKSAKPNAKTLPLEEEREYEKEKELYLTIGELKIFDVMPILEIKEAALNARQKEHGLRSWKDMVPEWFRMNVQIDFNDELHIFNTFSKYIIQNGKPKSEKNGVKKVTKVEDLES